MACILNISDLCDSHLHHFACHVMCDVLFADRDGRPTIRPTERVCVHKLTCRYSIAVVMSEWSSLLSLAVRLSGRVPFLGSRFMVEPCL